LGSCFLPPIHRHRSQLSMRDVVDCLLGILWPINRNNFCFLWKNVFLRLVLWGSLMRVAVRDLFMTKPLKIYQVVFCPTIISLLLLHCLAHPLAYCNFCKIKVVKNRIKSTLLPLSLAQIQITS
jgi:hypothetical protein